MNRWRQRQRSNWHDNGATTHEAMLDEGNHQTSTFSTSQQSLVQSHSGLLLLRSFVTKPEPKSECTERSEMEWNGTDWHNNVSAAMRRDGAARLRRRRTRVGQNARARQECRRWSTGKWQRIANSGLHQRAIQTQRHTNCSTSRSLPVALLLPRLVSRLVSCGGLSVRALCSSNSNARVTSSNRLYSQFDARGRRLRHRTGERSLRLALSIHTVRVCSQCIQCTVRVCHSVYSMQLMARD